VKMLAAFAECAYILSTEYCREVQSAYMRCTAKSRGDRGYASQTLLSSGTTKLPIAGSS